VHARRVHPPAPARVSAESEDGLELTEQGWREKVTHPAHGRMVPRLILHLARLGVPAETLYDNTRLTREANGLRYIPDLFVVLPSNPVPTEDRTDYAGVPDLVIEVLSPGQDDQGRDV